MAYEILAVRNVMRVIDELADVRQLPGELVWSGRVNAVPALDEEIMGHYTGRVYAADLIADDQRSIVRAPAGIRLTQTKIPKLKHGELITERMMNILDRIEDGTASRRDRGVFTNYINTRVESLVNGVEQRIEALICAMLIDGFTYDRLGIKVTAGWGMPSDLKQLVSVLWTVANAATATPITDVLAMKRTGRQKYGVNYDRMTLSTAVLLALPYITEVQNFAALNMGISTGNLGLLANNVEQVATLFGNMVGMTVEINDSQYWTENDSAAETANRFIPENRVILSATAFDGDDDTWDFANGVVPETRRGTVPLMIGGFGGPQEGPVGYVTAADPHGDPPGLIAWGVGRGFPRKHKLAANAVLTVQA